MTVRRGFATGNRWRSASSLQWESDTFGVEAQVVEALGGIASAEAFGTAKANLTLALSGIAGAEAFGSATVATAGGAQSVTGVGAIASAEAFGTAKVNLKISGLGGIAPPGGEPTVTLLTTGNHTGNATSSTTTASISVEAGDVVIIDIETNGYTGGNLLPTSVSGAGLTFDLVGSTSDFNTWGRQARYRAEATGSGSGAVTLNYGTANWDLLQWAITRYRGLAAGANGANAFVQTVINQTASNGSVYDLTLSAFAKAENICHAAFVNAIWSSGGAGITATPGDSATELWDQNPDGDNGGGSPFYEPYSGFWKANLTGPDVTWTASSVNGRSGIASELSVTASAFGTPKVNFTVGLGNIATAEAFGSLTVAQSGGTQTITPTGLASEEAFGTAKASFTLLSLGGIATAETFGTAKANHAIAPAGISSLEAFGTAALDFTLPLSGIASGEAFGTAVVSQAGGGAQSVVGTGIASLEAFGSPQINLTLFPAAIGSAEAFGDATVRGTGVSHPAPFPWMSSLFAPGGAGGAQTVTATGIASLEAFGTAKVNLTLAASGIATGEAFGTAQINLKVAPAGIASLEAFGTPTIVPDQFIAPAGIASGEAFGTTRIGLKVTPAGIASAEAFGTAAVEHVIRPTGIAGAEAFGTPQIHYRITLPGIGTAEAFGNAVIVQVGGPQFILPSGIATGETFGGPDIILTIEVEPPRYYGGGLSEEVVRKQWELLESRRKRKHDDEAVGETVVPSIPRAPLPSPEDIVVVLEPPATAEKVDPGFMTDQEIIDLVLMLEAIDD